MAVPVSDRQGKGDVIYRQAAIDALEEPCKVSDTWTDEYAVGERTQWEKDVKALNSLPSAQKKGHWIEDGYSHYKAACSECGEPCATYAMDKPRDRFCKWCGADMRGDANEDT